MTAAARYVCAILGLLAGLTAFEAEPPAVQACTYGINRDPSDWVRRADVIAFGTAGDPSGELGARIVDVDRWLLRPADAPGSVPAMVPDGVCWGPNALEPGERYLLFLNEPRPRGPFSDYWAGSPMAAYRIDAGDVLREVDWEGRGQLTEWSAGLAGLTEQQAAAELAPYLEFRAALTTPATSAPREAALRTITLHAAAAPREDGSLAEVANAYQHAFIGRVTGTQLTGPKNPESFHTIEVERWVWNPPPEPKTSLWHEQRGLYFHNWSLLVPGDPTLLPGQRLLFFSQATRAARDPYARFPIVDGNLTASDSAWATLPITETLAGLTETEAIAHLQRCLEIVPPKRQGGRATVLDHCDS